MISLILGTISQYVLLVIDKIGYAGIFFLAALGAANIPIPSEVIWPFSGFLANTGKISFWLAIFIGVAGDLAGSLFSYWLGYQARKNVFHWDNHKISANVERARKWLDRFGDWAVFLCRMTPVARAFISFPLGVLKFKSISRFAALTAFGSFVWFSFLSYLGFVFGENWQVLQIYFRKFDYVIVAVILIIGVWGIWKYFKK
ncbi:MAG: DedA family protein [Patescibacteria group bacterium]|nr:DedA family protein [Patescibacteria group bacterium]